MKHLIKNADPRSNPVTTGLGILALIVGLTLLFLHLFVETKQPIEKMYIGVAFAAAVVFLVIPDKFKKAAGRVVDRKSKEL